MSKLTLHCQGVPHWVGSFLARAGATHIKIVDNYPVYPNVVTIGRVYYDQTRVDEQVQAGAAGADVMFDACWPEIEKNPQVGIWETPANEASIWDAEVAAGYVAFSQRMTQRFHDAGKKIIAGAINVGWPRLPSEDGGAMMRLVQDAVRGADGLSFHEYGLDDMREGATYYCLRYRRFHEYVQGDHPPIYITECGLDKPGPPPDYGRTGWRIILDDDEDAYIEQLVWYEQELRQDDYVVCATIFTAGPSGWDSFEMYEGVSMKLARQLAGLEPPGGDMERRIFDVHGQQQTEAWLLSKYGQIKTTAEAGAEYGIVELREKIDAPSTLVVTVKDESGNPVPNVSVAFSWPDGTVHGITDNMGNVGFGMGGGAYYFPPEKGPHWIDAGGVRVEGLGMLGGTNHDHMDVVLIEGELEPPTYYTLAVAVEPENGGYVGVSPDPPYEAGAIVTLIAVSADGWVFNHWSGDALGTSPTATVVMSADKKVKAHFEVAEPPDDCCEEIIRLMNRIIELLEVIAAK